MQFTMRKGTRAPRRFKSMGLVLIVPFTPFFKFKPFLFVHFFPRTEPNHKRVLVLFHRPLSDFPHRFVNHAVTGWFKRLGKKGGDLLDS